MEPRNRLLENSAAEISKRTGGLADSADFGDSPKLGKGEHLRAPHLAKSEHLWDFSHEL